MPIDRSFGLIIVGDEILSGKRSDAHMPHILNLLNERGLRLQWVEYVGDEPQRLTATLQRAFAARGSRTLCCGGIGSTPDDHTRACAAAALGVPLVLHEQAVAFIDQRMHELAAERGEAFDYSSAAHQQRRQMGVLPQGATLIPNPYNRIAGFSCQSQTGAVIHFMPGFPIMAHPMAAWVLDTLYPALHHKDGYEERSLIVRGALESELTALMQDIERQHPAIKIFSLPSVNDPDHGRHIELGVKGEPVHVQPAWDALLLGLQGFEADLGPVLQRRI